MNPDPINLRPPPGADPSPYPEPVGKQNASPAVLRYWTGLSQRIDWQLAGDLLANPSLKQRIVTGFVRMNPNTDEVGAMVTEVQKMEVEKDVTQKTFT